MTLPTLRSFACAFALLLWLAFATPLAAAWYWPFGKSKPKSGPPPEMVTNGRDPSKRGITTPGDKTQKVYKKRSVEDGISIKKVKDLAKRGNANAQLTLGKVYFDGLAGEKQNFRKAFQYFSESAKNGNPEAMYNLGICHDGGFGTRKDLNQAIFWYEKAADRGVPEAQLRSAAYADAQNRPQTAFKYYRMLADGGDLENMHRTALCFLNGYGTPPLPEEAVRYLRMAAEKGFTRAQVLLADCYQRGLGVQTNYAEMSNWLMVAAHAGDPEAQAKLGRCFQSGMGVAQNPEMAFHWYKISAEGKYTTGQYLLGICYRDGIGTQPNRKLAFDNFLLAAEAGDPLAQYEVAEAYRNGDGVPASPEKTLEWLSKAAQAGLPVAQARYATLLLSQPGATDAQRQEAHKWLEKAMESGDPGALIQAALCYHTGEGLKQDREKARALLRQAMQGGSQDAAAVYRLLFGEK